MMTGMSPLTLSRTLFKIPECSLEKKCNVDFISEIKSSFSSAALCHAKQANSLLFYRHRHTGPPSTYIWWLQNVPQLAVARLYIFKWQMCWHFNDFPANRIVQRQLFSYLFVACPILWLQLVLLKATLFFKF